MSRPESPGLAPIAFEEARHGLCHASVFEEHRGPGWLRYYRIQQSHHAALAVEHREFHRQGLRLPNLHARPGILIQSLPVKFVLGWTAGSNALAVTQSK